MWLTLSMKKNSMTAARSAAGLMATLQNAIISNSLEIVRDLLQSGADANAKLSVPALDDVKDDEAKTIPKHIWFASSSPRSRLSPLHVAILNCYHEGKVLSLKDKGFPNAIGILHALIDHGADVENAARSVHVCNISGWMHHQVEDGTSPCDFALFLKQNPDSTWRSEQGSALDHVIAKLQEAKRAAGHVKPKLVLVPETVLETWRSLLFAEEFSDVAFVCEDGTVLPAHKNVLAASSDYFRAMLTGPWATQADGRVQTSNDPTLLRAVLKFVYTGALDEKLLESQHVGLLSLANEYGLSALKKRAERCCIRAIAATNIKSMLQLAQLHEAKELKTACFAFVKRNAAPTLTDPTFMLLATEDVPLWAELVTAIGGKTSDLPATVASAGGKKRGRNPS